MASQSFVLFLLMAAGIPYAHPQAPPSDPSPPASKSASPASAPPADPAEIFQHGQEALDANQLDAAEHDFSQVLQLDPKSGAAYANLGVVRMRRKQWDEALEMFNKADLLLPNVPGIRLNIGLAYYRQNEFLKAIPPFESVLHDQPSAEQPRYLLGLCYFFAQKWADAANTLEPLWPQHSSNLEYLYVLSNAAHRAGLTALDERATAEFARLGTDSPEYHLYAGKYHLESGQSGQAIAEFNAAAKLDPNLPYVHFYLGLANAKKQEYSAARDEFLKDAAIEPDLALDYDQLGEVYWLLQDDQNAEKNYREALQRNPGLVNSHIGLAKLYQKQKKYADALGEADAAVKSDPERPDTHYIRGQALLHLDRKPEAKAELQQATRIQDSRGAPQEVLPSPELQHDQR